VTTSRSLRHYDGLYFTGLKRATRYVDQETPPVRFEAGMTEVRNMRVDITTAIYHLSCHYRGTSNMTLLGQWQIQTIVLPRRDILRLLKVTILNKNLRVTVR
jgi:hypothetical protein